MNIAFLSYSFPPRIISGAGFYADEFTSALAEQGQKVSVFVPADENLPRDGSNRHIVPIHLLNARGSRAITFALMLAMLLKSEDFDIIHSQGGAGILCSRIDIETIHHYPLYTLEQIQFGLNFLSSLRAKTIITISEQSKANLVAHSFSQRKVQVIPNGISSTFISALRESRSNCGGERKHKAILYINTTLEKRKNLPLALEIFARIRKSYPNCVMNIVGPNFGRSIVFKLASRMNIHHAINYYGELKAGALVELYKKSDVLIVTSTQEGFGFPLLEAVSVGIPFVSSNVGIASDLSEHGFGYIAKTREEFTSLVSKSLDLGICSEKSGFQFIVDNFSWKKSAEKTIHLYEEILHCR